MDHPEGAGSERGERVDFDRRVQLEFRGTQLTSDGGLLVMRELDDALGLSDLASGALPIAAKGRTGRTGSTACFGNRSMAGCRSAALCGTAMSIAPMAGAMSSIQ